MEFTQKQKAWILLVCIIIGTGGTTFVVNFAGGAVWWCALIGGLAAGCGQIVTALMKSPNDHNDTKP